MTKGKCVGMDPDLFHLPGAGTFSNEARDACNACPVRDQCLAFAMAHMNDDLEHGNDYGYGMYGMWGGTTRAERFRMLGRRTAQFGQAA